jgi:hypothetical protein
MRWLVLDCAAITDTDYAASTVLAQAEQRARQRHIGFVCSRRLY